MCISMDFKWVPNAKLHWYALHLGFSNKKKNKVFMSCLTVFLLEPLAVEHMQNLTVKEGRNVTKECKVAGTPPRTVFWKNVYTGEVRSGKLLNISNIRRNQRGEYSCYANNTCGSDTTKMFIDVQCKNVNITF